MSTRCYGIDGTPYATFDRYIPCNAIGAAAGGHTSCCAPGDNCLTNGLCQGQGDNKRKANLFWRNGCTDPTWNDPSCPKHCEGLDKPDTHAVFYCLKSNSWCCPTGAFNGDTVINTTCCTLSDLTFNAPDPLVYTIAEINMVSTAFTSVRIAATPTPISQSFVVSSASQPTQSLESSLPSPLSSAFSSPSSSNNKTGIYVGVPLGIALAIALAVIAWLLLKNRRLKQAQAIQYTQPNSFVAHYKQSQYVQANELATPSEELPAGNHMRAELGIGK